MTSNKQYIAIDIAKQTLQVQSDLKSLSLSYDKDGLKQLRTFIAQHQTPMVIAEATGGYERALMHMLYKYNISVALINPKLARAFAISEGIKARFFAIFSGSRLIIRALGSRAFRRRSRA